VVARAALEIDSVRLQRDGEQPKLMIGNPSHKLNGLPIPFLATQLADRVTRNGCLWMTLAVKFGLSMREQASAAPGQECRKCDQSVTTNCASFRRLLAKSLRRMARPKGFEPLTPRFVVWVLGAGASVRRADAMEMAVKLESGSILAMPVQRTYRPLRRVYVSCVLLGSAGCYETRKALTGTRSPRKSYP
jgi:hypothetical protein